jgi:hypothetical protein
MASFFRLAHLGVQAAHPQEPAASSRQRPAVPVGGAGAGMGGLGPWYWARAGDHHSTVRSHGEGGAPGGGSPRPDGHGQPYLQQRRGLGIEDCCLGRAKPEPGLVFDEAFAWLIQLRSPSRTISPRAGPSSITLMAGKTRSSPLQEPQLAGPGDRLAPRGGAQLPVDRDRPPASEQPSRAPNSPGRPARRTPAHRSARRIERLCHVAEEDLRCRPPPTPTQKTGRCARPTATTASSSHSPRRDHRNDRTESPRTSCRSATNDGPSQAASADGGPDATRSNPPAHAVTGHPADAHRSPMLPPCPHQTLPPMIFAASHQVKRRQGPLY